MKNILLMAKKMESSCIADRQYLHRHPELSFQEENTMHYICKRLDALKIPYKNQIAGTGILAEVKGKGDGKCLLIRADMDALPLREQTDLPYASQNENVMHACGHDVHTAILLSTCELLNQCKDEFLGTVKFAFQPGEETSGGAKPMIDAGVLQNPAVDACIALHVDTDIPVGTVRIKEGTLYASPDDFYITLKGKGAHGAEPQNAIEVTEIAAEIIPKLHALRDEENGIVSVCSVHAGSATNVIPDTLTMCGTARSLNREARVYLENAIHQIVRDVCLKFHAEYTYRFEKLFPPLVNHPQIAELLKQSATACLEESNCIWGGKPTMAGEDFAYFSQAVPSALMKLGCRNEEKGIVAPIHSPYFNIDESAMKNGVAIFADFALRFLKEPPTCS